MVHGFAQRRYCALGVDADEIQPASPGDAQVCPSVARFIHQRNVARDVDGMTGERVDRGHADLHTYSTGCMIDLGDRGGWLHTCDGEAECLRAVRLQLRRNAKLINANILVYALTH